jgi:hypothetical protein
MTILRNIALALAIASAAATAQAGVKASAVRAGAGVNTTSPAQVAARLNHAGAAGETTLSFNLGSAGKKILTFSARCAVTAPAGNTTAWLDLDIVVNGIVVAPTVGSGDPFCSANGTAGGLDGQVRRSITVPVQGIQGSNTVQVLARGNGGASGLYLGDLALVIHD